MKERETSLLETEDNKLLHRKHSNKVHHLNEKSDARKLTDKNRNKCHKMKIIRKT